MSRIRVVSRLLSAWNEVAETMNEGARYIIRLDDACDTQDSEKWNRIEQVLDRHNIKPIVAVIPNNQDLSLNYSVKDANFWNRVALWQAKGWTIALHGYRHLYHKVDRKRLLIPFHDRSEFAGLEYSTQLHLISKAYVEFVQHDIFPKVWVAPSHAFDINTLAALKAATPIRLVSDGIALNPYPHNEFVFIPQQIWSLKKRQFGIWTICLHPNTMSNADIEDFSKHLSSKEFLGRFTSATDAVKKSRKLTYLDKCYSAAFFAKWNLSKMYRLIVATTKRIQNNLVFK